MKRRGLSKIHNFEREGGLCPGSLNAVLCYLGIINHQALHVLHEMTPPRSCRSPGAGGFLTPKQGVTLWFPVERQHMPQAEMRSCGRSGKTLGTLQDCLTVRPGLLFTEGSGSPKPSSWASGTRPAGLFCWKFHDVAELFSKVASLVYPASLTRCLCTGLAEKL